MSGKSRSLHKPLAREGKEMQLLFEVSQILDSSLDLRDVLLPVLQSIARHLDLIRGTITLMNDDTGEMHIEAAHGLSESEMERGRYKPGEGVVGKVAQGGKAVIVPRVADSPEFLDKTGARKTLRKQDISFICVPIKLGKQVVGTLSADRELFGEGPAGEDDMRLLSVVASMIAQAVRLRRMASEERRRLMEENIRLQEELKDRFHPANIIGKSKAMQSVYDLIARVSKSDATVLIRGESGSGKELVAHAIHYNSLRAGGPYVKVNCAALPETLIESELFGHERGAFTGAAAQRKGRFELAGGGSIFLDEIGDLSPAMQVKLLRVLQEREFERVGGSELVRCDVRVIAATNRNLEGLMDAGKFRQDLYYRLNVFPIHIPPLRERRSDILLLAEHFAAKYAKTGGKDVRRISTPAIDMLMAYHWPGNVRELENCMERAVILGTDGVIHGHHLPPTLQTAEASGTAPLSTLKEAVDNLEREMIVEALKLCRGNMAKAARNLGVTERIMGLRMRNYDIDFRRFRSGGGAGKK